MDSSLKSQLISLQNQLSKISNISGSTPMSPPIFSTREEATKSKPFTDDIVSEEIAMNESALTEKLNDIVMNAIEKELSKIFNK